MYFDFENNQPFLKTQTRGVNLRRFTCIKIGNERFEVKICDHFFIKNIFDTKMYH